MAEVRNRNDEKMCSLIAKSRQEIHSGLYDRCEMRKQTREQRNCTVVSERMSGCNEFWRSVFTYQSESLTSSVYTLAKSMFLSAISPGNDKGIFRGTEMH